MQVASSRWKVAVANQAGWQRRRVLLTRDSPLPARPTSPAPPMHLPGARGKKGKRQKGAPEDRRKAKVVGVIPAHLHQKTKVARTDSPLLAKRPGEGPGVRSKCPP